MTCEPTPIRLHRLHPTNHPTDYSERRDANGFPLVLQWCRDHNQPIELCTNNEEDEEDPPRYSIYAREHGGQDWMAYAYRSTEEGAIEQVQALVERGWAAFYVPGVLTVEDEWNIRVDPAA